MLNPYYSYKIFLLLLTHFIDGSERKLRHRSQLSYLRSYERDPEGDFPPSWASAGKQGLTAPTSPLCVGQMGTQEPTD